MISRVFRMGRIQYGPGTSLGPRATIEYEFVRIIKGEVTWRYNGLEHQLKPGSITLSQPGGREDFTWDENTLTLHDFFHFEIEKLGNDFPPPETWPNFVQLEPGNILHSFFDYLVQLSQSEAEQHQETLKGLAEQMLNCWAKKLYHLEQPSFRQNSKAIQNILDEANRRWQEQNFRPLSLNEMIRSAKVSRSTMIRLFQKECGMNPAQYFEKMRLHLGLSFLLESDLRITQIAEKLGYANAFHFSNNFRKYFGQSPSMAKQGKLKSESLENQDFKRTFNALMSQVVF